MSRKTIETIEVDIDLAFSASALKDIGYAQAVWTLLSVTEDAYLKYIHLLDNEQLHTFADVHLSKLTYPLRVCLKNSNSSSQKLKKELIDEHYQLALDWLRQSDDYYNWNSIFPLWHNGKIEFVIDNKRISFDRLTSLDVRYEAYNRFNRKEGKNEDVTIPNGSAIIDLLLSATTIHTDWFKVNFNPKIVSRLVSFFSPFVKSRYNLPEEWKFQKFTLTEYKVIIITLQAMLYGWHSVRTVLANAGMPGIGYKSSVWVVGKDELINRLCRYTDLEIDTVTNVLYYITFGNMDIRRPDIAIQPLIDLKNGFYALSPFVWLNTNTERNLCVLLNQIDIEKGCYSRLTNEKEVALREEIKEFLAPFDFDIAYGALDNTDLDIAIIDRTNKCCLCLELKWFIEPAEIREIHDRSEELLKGIVQAKKLITLFQEHNHRLIKDVLKIDQDYSFFTAVGSKNWIGHEDVQDIEVPIIKIGHLLHKIQEGSSLTDVVQWLATRSYLPVKGTDYEVSPWEISCGGWNATWYGIKTMKESSS